MNAFQAKAYAELRALAHEVERVVDRTARGFRGDEYHELTRVIEEQERQHRRFTGTRYTFPVSCAVAYFVVRVFNEAVADKREAIPWNELDGMRRDYLMARIIVSRNREAWRPLADKLSDLSAKYDYTELVGGKAEQNGGES